MKIDSVHKILNSLKEFENVVDFSLDIEYLFIFSKLEFDKIKMIR